MFHVVALAALLALMPQVRAEEPADTKGPSAADLLAQGLAAAKNDGKRVFLLFGSPSCGWCRYFDKFHADADVTKVIGKYFVIVKVDLVANPGGEEMDKKYGTDRGVPAWSILGPGAKILTDSGDGKDTVGFPYEKQEVERYVKSIRTAAPKLTDDEAELLKKKLRIIGPKLEKDEKKEQ